MKSLYQILGVDKDASTKEIRKAYESLAQKHHPDRPDGDPDLFSLIRCAWDVLGNPQARERYDQGLQ